MPPYAPPILDFSGLGRLADDFASGYDATMRRRDIEDQRRAPLETQRVLGNLAPAAPASPSGQIPVASNAAASGDMARYANAIKANESGGNYQAIGPVHPTMGRALGAYQVMEANVGPWTKEVLGQPLTPDQFLASPEAQDRVFSAKFGQSVQKYGNPQDAASVWFTGRPLAQGASRRDALGTTGQSYVDKFSAGLGKPTQVSQADIPASGATEAQGFAVPGQQQPVSDISAKVQQMMASPNPYVRQYGSALAQKIAEKQITENTTANQLDIQQKRLAIQKAQRDLEDGGAQPLTPQERVSFGIPNDQVAYKTRSGEIKFGPKGTTVNIDQKAESEEQKQRGTGLGKRLNDIAEDGAKAGEDAIVFQRMGDLLNNVQTGKWTEAREKIRQITGITLDPNADQVQGLNALIQYLAPRLRVPGSGAQSDRELGNFLSSIPSLAGTPGGNRIILDTLSGIIENRRQRASIATQWQLGDISAKDAQKQLDAVPSPFKVTPSGGGASRENGGAPRLGSVPIPPAAVKMLQGSPNLRDQFDQKYGSGASDRILGPRQ